MREFIFRYFPSLAYRLSRAKRKIIIFIHKHYSIKAMQKYISKKYYAVHGYEMNWINPSTYTQKIQYSKLFNRDKRRTLYSDKVAVREYVKKTIGEEYLIPLLGIWDCFDDIDFDSLPSKFILKTNHGSGTNIIVEDKTQLDLAAVKRKINSFLNDDFAYYGFELQYAGIKPLVFAEELLDFSDEDIEDYKFLCFDGNVYCFWIDFNRNTYHKRNVYDLDWNLLSWNQWDYGNYQKDVLKPDNFDEMVDVVKKLCVGFDHVRVDLYNVKGKIYFGELTFTNGSGFEPIYPRSMDYTLGNQWNLKMLD